MNRLTNLCLALLVTVIAFALPVKMAHAQEKMSLTDAIRAMVVARESGSQLSPAAAERAKIVGNKDTIQLYFKIELTEGMKSKGINRFSYHIIPMEGERWGVLRSQYINPLMTAHVPREVGEMARPDLHYENEIRVGDAQIFNFLPEALDHACEVADRYSIKADRKLDWKLEILGENVVSNSDINLVGNFSRPNQIFEFTLTDLRSSFSALHKQTGGLRDALYAVATNARDNGIRGDGSPTIEMLRVAAKQLAPQNLIISKGAFAESIRRFRASLVHSAVSDVKREARLDRSTSPLSAAASLLMIDLNIVKDTPTSELEALAKQLRKESKIIREAPRPDEAVRTLADPSKGFPGYDKAVAQAIQQLEMEITWRKLESAVANFARTGKLGEEAKSIPEGRLWIRDAQFLEALEKGGEAGTSFIPALRKSIALESEVRRSMGITMKSVHDLPGSVTRFEISEPISGISRRDLGSLKLPEEIGLTALLDQGGDREPGKLAMAIENGVSVVGVSTQTTGSGGTEIAVLQGTIGAIGNKVLDIDVGGENVEVPRDRTLLYMVTAISQEGARPSNPEMREAVSEIAAEGGHRADVISARDAGRLPSEAERHSLENMKPSERMASIRKLIETEIRDYAEKR